MTNKLDFYCTAIKSVASKCNITVSVANAILFNLSSGTKNKKPIDASINQQEVKDALIDAGLLIELQGAA